jgi:hypothetical protein
VWLKSGNHFFSLNSALENQGMEERRLDGPDKTQVTGPLYEPLSTEQWQVEHREEAFHKGRWASSRRCRLPPRGDITAPLGGQF